MVLASALLWMQYVDCKDRLRHEPRARLLTAFFLGIVAWLAALLFFILLEKAGVAGVESGGRAWKALYCFGLIGPVEEGAKLSVACLFVFRWREFDEPIDGFVYAAAISLGFASVENFYNVPTLPRWEQLARAATVPLTHSLFAAVWGFGIAHARMCVAPGGRRMAWYVGASLGAMLLHGLYDFLLFACHAAWASSGLILVLWCLVIRQARRCLARKEPAAKG